MLTRTELKRARKETIAFIKKAIKPGLQETKLPDETKDAYLKVFFFSPTRDVVSSPKKAFVAYEIHGVCVYGVVESASVGAVTIIEWDHIPLDDLIMLEEWITSILRVRTF